EREHGVGHPAALLVDHDTLDRADLVAIGAVDRSSLDLVVADQVAGFVCFQRHAFLQLGFEGWKTKGVTKRSCAMSAASPHAHDVRVTRLQFDARLKRRRNRVDAQSKQPYDLASTG